jgi:hypothetical protein
MRDAHVGAAKPMVDFDACVPLQPHGTMARRDFCRGMGTSNLAKANTRYTWRGH